MKFATLVSLFAVAAAETHHIDCNEWFDFSESNESSWKQAYNVSHDGH